MKQLLLITLTLVLMLTYAGCRLEQLHDTNPPPGCASIINDIIYDQHTNYRASDIIKTDDRYIVCGNETSTRNTFLMEIDANGQQNFFKIYNNQTTNIGTYTANSVVQIENSNRYIICGKLATGLTRKAFFAVCNSEGELESQKVSDVSNSQCEYIRHLNGKYVFAGYKGGVTTEDIYVGTVQPNSDSITLAEYIEDIDGNQRIYAVEAYQNDGFLFVGHTIGMTDLAKPCIFHYDKNFETFSECPTNSLGVHEIYPRCITAMSGGYMLSGYLEKTENAVLNAFTLQMDTDCNYNSLNIIDSDENVKINGITEINGDYLICGNKKSGTGDAPVYAYALKVDVAGRFLNEYAHDENMPETTTNIVATDECNYITVGYTGTTTDPNMLVITIGE